MTSFSNSLPTQASIAGTAIATLQKELSATSAQKITKSVKAPTVKPSETRVRAEPTPSPQFPFADLPDTYKSQAGIEVKKDVGVSITGTRVREEHLEVLRGRETKVGGRLHAVCGFHPHSRGAGQAHCLFSSLCQTSCNPACCGSEDFSSKIFFK